MKVVILAGGLGTRLAEETETRPKPMVEIGGEPILLHIMKLYAHHGYRDFAVALGYRGDVIKRYFLDRLQLEGDFTLLPAQGEILRHQAPTDDWTLHLVDTGLASNTGGRLGRLRDWIGDETFMLTYGDGVADVDLGALLAFHRRHSRTGTVTAVRPPARFGGLVFDDADDGIVAQFTEKPQIGEGWINGGFMVFEPGVFDLIGGDATNLEVDVLEPLAGQGQLAAYRHSGFWQCMDTLRDKRLLDQLWQSGAAPWTQRP